MNNKVNCYFVKIDRIAAWTLLISIFLYIISGYGMTKGIVDAKLATQIHNDYLPFILLASFSVHTFYAIRMTFKRWKIWDGFGRWLLVLVYLIFIGSFVYIDMFYKKTNDTKAESVKINTTQTNNSSDTTATSAEKTFTVDELAAYDGQNGQPAYVAVDGVVYDMTSVFSNGTHFSHYAGQELTKAFYSEHSLNQITKYPVIGKLK